MHLEKNRNATLNMHFYKILCNVKISDVRMANSDDEACTQAAANNLEAFRRIAQAHAERERFLPGAPVMMNNPLAQNLNATASDYMRLAMPVRDPDNGDAISGSGKFNICCFNSKHVIV